MKTIKQNNKKPDLALDIGTAALSVSERRQFEMSALRGLPIEYDLSRYQSDLSRMRAIDLKHLSSAQIETRARLVKQTISETTTFAREIKAGSTNRESRDGKRQKPTWTDEIVAEVFALSTEAVRRTLGLEVYDLQIIAALAMARGRLVQMQTGEGKTLAAALAVATCALREPGIHVFTANDYLAQRDATWMKPVYDFWGLTVAHISSRHNADLRRTAYASDICYLTAKEAGFDYLRDQLAYRVEDQVQRELNMVLVDEADFILIDEARIPLVIAGPGEPDGIDPNIVRDVVARLSQGEHFNVDPRGKKVSFTLSGQKKVEDLMLVKGMQEVDSAPVWARAHAALYAQFLVRKDIDYIVQGGRVRLVDEFTGRVMEQRRWPWGIQTALEALEGLEIQDEGRPYGSITIQHFVAMYRQRAGMTATALPSAREFLEVYGLQITLIPPAKPVIRVDEDDRVFQTKSQKHFALVERISAEHRKGRPVLVGTASVSESNQIASLLEENNIGCKVLNAANDFEEAAIIAVAGRRGAVTISTNMAGRGTDIKLAHDGSEIELADVCALGGLLVIGTNRHESRRIDDQLRGRAGRQGEPGTSAMYVSLEDPLFEKYGVREFLPPQLDDPRTKIELNRAQRLIESENNEIRRTLRKYSMLVEFDRRYIRMIRDQALQDGVLPDFLSQLEDVAVDEIRPAKNDHAIDPLLLRIFLYHLDRFWADHLAAVDSIREGIHMVLYGGREPSQEFNRHIAEAFESGLGLLADKVRTDWEKLCKAHPRLSGSQTRENATTIDALFEQTGFLAPSSTWTYMVDDVQMPTYRLSMIASSNLGTAAIAGPFMAVVQWVERVFRRKR